MLSESPYESSPGIQAALKEFAPQIQELGLTVRMFEPSEQATAWGFYEHGTRTIWLRARLGPLQARSTLAHELAHATHGHDGQQDAWEREAEATAVEQLITSEALEATAVGLNLTGALAVALGVLPRDVTRFIETHPEQASKAIMRALAQSNGFTIPKPNDYRREHQPIIWDQDTIPEQVSN